MEQYKSEFIQFMVDSKVLKFGEFTLKSGRKSPFFMNAGGYVTGSQLKKLGEYYAKAIHDKYGDDFDVLFGPAYKGIPLAVGYIYEFIVFVVLTVIGKSYVEKWDFSYSRNDFLSTRKCAERITFSQPMWKDVL